MAVLSSTWFAIAVGAAACYSPELRDCTVTCANAADCASGQVCGTDGFCAGPGVTGSCGTLPDAGADEARPVDAAATDGSTDAALATLHVEVSGDGKVEITGIGTCDARAPHGGDCTYSVLAGVAAMLTAVPHPGSRFDKWESVACDDHDDPCVATPVVSTLVTAKFKHTHDDDDVMPPDRGGSR